MNVDPSIHWAFYEGRMYFAAKSGGTQRKRWLRLADRSKKKLEKLGIFVSPVYHRALLNRRV